MAKGKYNTPTHKSVAPFQDDSGTFNENALQRSKQSTKNVGGHQGHNSKPGDMPSKKLAR